MKVFEGMTFQEIADMTGESINTVASRYRYAIEKLRVASDMSDVEDPPAPVIVRPVLRPTFARGFCAWRKSPVRSAIRDWLPTLAAAALIVLFSALSYSVRVDIDSRLAAAGRVAARGAVAPRGDRWTSMTRRIPTWSRVVFILLLPVVAYNVWDYVESRRLQSRLRAIERRGEPTSTAHDQRPAGDAARAERFYRAAGALATEPQDVSIAVRNSVMQAWREGRWTPETLDIARTTVAQNREALDLADRAATLPFVGFLGGTSYNYRVGDLLRLCRLCEWRAAVAVSEGNADAALASFVSEARLVRALDLAPVPLGTQWPAFSGLSAAAAANTSASGRAAVGHAFADIDQDDRPRSALINSRVLILNGSSPFSIGFGRGAANPFVAHILVRQLDVFAALIAAADRPWPNRTEAVNAVGLWPLGFATRNEQSVIALRGYTKSVAEQVRRIRCARMLVSSSALSLVDPFSGKSLEAGSCHL